LGNLTGVRTGESQVVIAGGGPTGLWLACELALARVRVTVLEGLAAPTGLSKALGLQSRTMEMLDHRGVLERFTAGGETVPFLNFAMFPLDVRRIDFPTPTVLSFRNHASRRSSRSMPRKWARKSAAGTK
jgi:2-polyprenyl-6-methoxyphenol hydroxylase-like FAD-dependent oxidoreductase